MKNKRESANALTRLESAFSHRIAGGHWNGDQADFWAQMVYAWPEDTCVSVCEKIIAQFDSFPSAAEVLRLKREHDDSKAKPTGQPASIDGIAAGSRAPWWFTLTATLQKRGIKMAEIGDALMAEAKRRNETLPKGLYLGNGRIS